MQNISQKIRKEVEADMKSLSYVLNPYGFKVRRMCASCAFKSLEKADALRWCTKHNLEVSPYRVCRFWRMSNQLKKAGKR